MNGPTPDQQRRINEAYESVDQYWFVDLSTKELRRRPLLGIRRLINSFWKKRHTVWEFYWWIRRRQAQDDMMPLDNPIRSDNTPIKGVPTKYELQGGWTIPQDDMKYLIKGPLTSENNLTDILVPIDQPWERWMLYIKRLGIMSPIIAVIGAIYHWRVELSELFQRANYRFGTNKV